MAGMGPPPKASGMRQRKNKTVPGAILPAEGSQRPAPPLPDRECPCVSVDKTAECGYCDATGVQPWHPLVLERWAIAWASPMAAEWLAADVHGLFIVADLWDGYWKGNRGLAAEIRLQEQRFGLSSLDRRRLQWEVEKVEQAQKRRPAVPGRTAAVGRRDPRSFLKAIK
jgi:hypothetical protein